EAQSKTGEIIQCFVDSVDSIPLAPRHQQRFPIIVKQVDTETRVTISPQMLRALVQIVGAENVISGEDELLVYECDAYTLEKNLPNVVVLRRTTEEVSKIAAL